MTGELLTPKEQESIYRHWVRSVKLPPGESQLSINPSCCEIKDGETARKVARLELNFPDPSYTSQPRLFVARTALHPRAVFDGNLHDTLSYVNTPDVHFNTTLSTPWCLLNTPLNPLGTGLPEKPRTNLVLFSNENDAKFQTHLKMIPKWTQANT